MLSFNLKLFTDEDLKSIEDMLVRALVRAARVASKERLVPGYSVPTEPAPPQERAPAYDRFVRLLSEAVTSFIDKNKKTPTDDEVREMTRSLLGPPAAPGHPDVLATPRAAVPPVAEHRGRVRARRMRDVLKTVAERPHGYVTTDEARNVIGRDEASKAAINRWLLEGEIPAVIVANMRPPTKGCPGRVVLDKEALIRRNEERIVNRENTRWATSRTGGDGKGEKAA